MEIGREEEILIKEEEILGAIHLLVIDVEEVLGNALDQGAKVEVEEALVEEVRETVEVLVEAVEVRILEATSFGNPYII